VLGAWAGAKGIRWGAFLLVLLPEAGMNPRAYGFTAGGRQRQRRGVHECGNVGFTAHARGSQVAGGAHGAVWGSRFGAVFTGRLRCRHRSTARCRWRRSDPRCGRSGLGGKGGKEQGRRLVEALLGQWGAQAGFRRATGLLRRGRRARPGAAAAAAAAARSHLVGERHEGGGLGRALGGHQAGRHDVRDGAGRGGVGGWGVRGW
jgi:hypothetical protein